MADIPTAVAEFARVRSAFHALLALDLGARAATLAGLQSSDAPLAAALQRLLAQLDENDLIAPPVAHTRIGTRIGAFEVLRSIGMGGMGEVYEARRVDADFDQRVALKVVRSIGLSAEMTRRFLQERQILARLQHPNIAHLLDGGIDANGSPWLALEYVDGDSITEWAQAQALDVRARIALFLQVTAAVGFAHDQLIVHRDLKPANVLIDRSGRAKLLDFGIAKLIDASADTEAATLLHPLTPRYAAPEQLAGAPATLTTDVYALGLLLVELLTGGSPFLRVRNGELSFSQGHLQGSVASLRQLALIAPPRGVEHQYLDARLDAIARRALAKAAPQRYPSVAALAADLNDWLAGRALRSGAGGAWDESRALLKRYAWPLTLVATLVLALSIGLLLARRESAAANAQRASAERHLDALLEVLSAASPRDFVGREPTASEQLQAAADAVASSYGSDPELQRRALTQIGVGLINLGRSAQAEPILGRALQAAVRTRSGSEQQLEILRLLTNTQDEPAAAERLSLTLRAIEQLAALQPSPIGIDALASAASASARTGTFAAADQALVLIDQQLAGGVVLTPSAAENTWRQRALIALRRGDANVAMRCIERSIAAMAQAPAEFSPLRRAEAELMRAEAALLLTDAGLAQSALDRAWPVFTASYANGHAQHTAISLLQTRVWLLGEKPLRAKPVLLAALNSANARDVFVARLLLAQIAVREKRCGDAKREFRRARPEALQLPREQQLQALTAAAIEARCQP